MAKPLTPPPAAAPAAPTPAPTDEPPDISAVMSGLKKTARKAADTRTKAIESLTPDMQEYFTSLDQSKQDDLLKRFQSTTDWEATEDPWGVKTQELGLPPRETVTGHVGGYRAARESEARKAEEDVEAAQKSKELHATATYNAYGRGVASQEGVAEEDIFSWFMTRAGKLNMPEGWTPPPGFEVTEADINR